MKKYITLKKDFSIKLNNSITKHLTPKYVYLPVNESDKLNAKKTVKKEEKLSETLISPVSGQIVGKKYCLTPDGKMNKCYAILNNYKETFLERKAMRKNMNKVSLEQMIIELKEFHYEELADRLLKTKERHTLILNGIEDEPYVANEIFIGKEYTNMVLETLDALKEIASFKQVKIIVKNNDRENIEAYSNFLGTYHNIELQLVPDYYLLGNNDFLREYLSLKEDSFFIRPSEIWKIHSTIKRRRYLTEHIFTISGDGIKNPQIIEAKIGSSVAEILEEHIERKKDEDCVIFVNGLMKGRTMAIENLIVTEDLNSILIMKKQDLPEEECINCGKCYSICPMGCNPRAYLKYHKKYAIKECIDCGLCSYICPSWINLRKQMKGEEHE